MDTPPRISETVNPVYPPGALRSRIRGLVILAVLVSETGTPLEIRVIQRARAGLTEAAVAAVRRWKFEPAEKDGVPVTTWTTVRVRFEAIPFPPPPTASPTRDTEPSARGRGGRQGAAASPAVGPDEGLNLPQADAVVRTRRAVRFGISPEQARIYVNGAYVGIADDWDGRGGGLDYPFTSRGGNAVRIELPGYRPLALEVVVTAAAGEEVLEITDELDRQSRESYRRLPAIVARTTGPVELVVEPRDVTVSVGGRMLGSARVFDARNPLRLPGPAAHDLVFSAPGHGSRMARVLVSPDAGVEQPALRVRLPKEKL